jgi:hypothetical protein
MQTFVPYADLEKSAYVLDRARLGKQRVENLQILKAITDPSYGWQNHPAVKMWQGLPGGLLTYQTFICNEWTKRGYKDTCLEKSLIIAKMADSSDWRMPAWLGDERIHVSHRSNLLRKLPEHYGSLFEPGLADDLPYFWPTEELSHAN